jgi:hypothetical protein
MSVTLHPDLRLSIQRGRASREKGDPGHTWEVRRYNDLVGTGWAQGTVEEAFEDAIDDMRMLGLVTDE